jgi:hypothetical protein
MHFASLTVDELAALCAVSPEARKYAGEHFQALLNRQEEAFWDMLEEGRYDHDLINYDALPATSEYWRIS